MTKLSTPKEILETAANMYESQEIGWHQFTYAKNIHGEHLSYMDDTALSYCALGIIRKLAANDDVLLQTKFNLGIGIIDWNDANGRTVVDVINKFREVANSL